LQFYIGTSGWSYSSWQGIFYPEKLEQKWWLPYYSQVFDYVEIDSTFYQIPSKNMVKLWNARTSPNFRFSAKFPQVITHVKKFHDCQKELELFYEAMEPLKNKLLTLLIQFPPSLKINEGLEALRQYDFLFSLTDQNLLDQYKRSRPIIVVNSLIAQYNDALKKNAGQNDQRVDLINIAQGFLLVGIILIPIPVALMLFK